MVRSIILGACALVLSLAAAETQAAERTHRAAEAPAAAEAARGENGVESIAEEAAEVSRVGSEPDGMTRNVDEMEAGEAEDGCTGSIGDEDESGCDLAPN